jgi:predicted nuclease with RNAse H fold
MTKDEFVKVNLKLGLAHSVVGADQPLLEVANGPVRKRDSRFRAFAQL